LSREKSSSPSLALRLRPPPLLCLLPSPRKQTLRSSERASSAKSPLPNGGGGRPAPAPRGRRPPPAAGNHRRGPRGPRRQPHRRPVRPRCVTPPPRLPPPPPAPRARFIHFNTCCGDTDGIPVPPALDLATGRPFFIAVRRAAAPPRQSQLSEGGVGVGMWRGGGPADLAGGRGRALRRFYLPNREALAHRSSVFALVSSPNASFSERQLLAHRYSICSTFNQHP
jgi:hypothetical protein